MSSDVKEISTLQDLNAAAEMVMIAHLRMDKAYNRQCLKTKYPSPWANQW